MLNEWLIDFSKAIWKDTDLAHSGGVIFSIPCRSQRPPFDVGLGVHITYCVFSGRTEVLPVVRSTQNESSGSNGRPENVAMTNTCETSKSLH